MFWLVVGAALITVYNLTDWDAKRTGSYRVSPISRSTRRP